MFNNIFFLLFCTNEKTKLINNLVSLIIVFKLMSIFLLCLTLLLKCFWQCFLLAFTVCWTDFLCILLFEIFWVEAILACRKNKKYTLAEYGKKEKGPKYKIRRAQEGSWLSKGTENKKRKRFSNQKMNQRESNKREWKFQSEDMSEIYVWHLLFLNRWSFAEQDFSCR